MRRTVIIGTGSYLRPKKNSSRYSEALDLAALLDQYNNGNVCPTQ